MNESRLADAAVRERAVHENCSFIVQAPAGSGKTELLTQRYLRLLATVEEPEEIVAITFTRKAASEMQQRILEALAMVDSEPPQEAHRRLTYSLAKAARDHDQARGWHLSQHPARLRVQTIDSFNAMLTRQMPVLAQFGSQPGISELPESLYLEAAENCLQSDDNSDEAHQNAVRSLLLHVDNDFPRARALLIGMLAKRDQWLEPLGGIRVNRDSLQSSLQHEIEYQMLELRRQVPKELGEELISLTAYAAGQMCKKDELSTIATCNGISEIPGTKAENFAHWRGISKWLLTEQGNWRKNVDVRVGFPPQDGGEKLRAQNLLVKLADHITFRERLHAVNSLPYPMYSEMQWNILDALLVLLPLAVAELIVVFGEHGEVDYAELALRALAALGGEDEPSDLALSLDYRITHLLVDEFQDTSSNQLSLLERLTAGWEQDDGRTLFVVGDPMQSIYRFREAEVGLFLRARKEGVGNVDVEPLLLNVNFRSQAGIVEWVNDVFAEVLPLEEDIASGAVPYSASVSNHPALNTAAVQVHPDYQGDPVVEADRVLDLVVKANADSENASTAILVSSRTHLVEIVPRLRQAGIRFRAVEIEHLGNRPVVQDLLALTRALFFELDRTAWLSILRAPWCGLSLSELHVLVADDMETPIIDLLTQSERIEKISKPGKQRVAKLVECMAAARRNSRRLTARDMVEFTWLQLGGPACLSNQADLDDVDAFLALIENLEEAGDLPDLVELESELRKLYAHADTSAPDSLQIMTMHKAKGLEFDTVILPGLGRKTRGDEARLLQWIERPREHGSDLLLATITETGAERDPVYDFLTTLQKEKHRHEQGRLLYVAATRTKRQLHILGHVNVKETKEGPEIRKPAENTLLARLWPKLENIFQEKFTESNVQDDGQVDEAIYHLCRLPADYTVMEQDEDVRGETRKRDIASEIDTIDYFWAGETARHVGTAVHAMLERIANEGAEKWDGKKIENSRQLVSRKLAELGVEDGDLNLACDRAISAIRNTLADDRGRWLLQETHANAAAELDVSGVIDNIFYNVSLDRTFIDENGTRWIVDYKTSVHEGTDTEEFVANERQRYRQQLYRYATLMRNYSDHPIRVGLYFPLLGEFDHWDPFEEPANG